ncbi:tripartite tricarboxylate transporter TctB family protein [Microvirga tunisiensis]|uniref:Tripartite tricarboxylate transporter TctB family protein n=2 Tax=Pannonibacter tanglangensis TaxID=2750084 RepID=A0A7X5F352_9HYPH|nr:MULTISPECIES: tripartite tricarboxylate transporter TctB family protein [unclassified Pannonibacter]NBN63997.1 tripartite tricarboxylate transporter TctB family protein [Pannonibacter sp. XCT-34]NBN77634.1 tripartite tricarboxylate transporter TctB family protein [Pannonibacter sp. XCT-53]
MRGDQIFGLVMIFAALGYLFSAAGIETSFLSDPVGPRVFPYIVGGVILVSSVVMILQPDPDAAWPGRAMLAKLALTLVVMVVYAVSVPRFGFVLPTVIASAILSYQISPRPGPAVLTGLGLGVGLFVIFKYALGLGLIGLPPAITG